MKDTIYFNHDYNAHLDPKVVKLRFKHWREWYWLYWATLEMMREDSDILIRWCELDANAYRLHCDIEKYKIFMSDLVEIWLIRYDKKDDVYYSCRLQSDVEYMRDKSAKASRSASIRWSKRDANALQTHSDGNAIDIYIYRNIERKRKDPLKITIEENQKLLNEWWTQDILDRTYDNIENYAKNWSYTSLYFTARKRLEKEVKPKTKQPVETPDTDPDLLAMFTLPWTR